MQQTGFAASDGSPSALAYSFKDAPNTGIYRDSSGALILQVAGVPTLRLTSTGINQLGGGDFVIIADDVTWTIDDFTITGDDVTWTIGDLAVTASGDVTFTPTGDFVVAATDDITLTADDLTFTGDDLTWTCDNFVITSNEANSLAVGRLGTTTPAFQVDASAATTVTGVKVTAAASGAGVDLAAISGAAAEELRVDAKGSSGVFVGSLSTGKVYLGLGSASPPILASGLTSLATDTDLTLTAAQLSTGLIVRTGLTGHRVDTVDTATNLQGVFTATTGRLAQCLYVNADDTHQITFVGGTGVTVSNPNAVLRPQSCATLYFRNTGAAAITMYIVTGSEQNSALPRVTKTVIEDDFLDGALTTTGNIGSIGMGITGTVTVANVAGLTDHPGIFAITANNNVGSVNSGRTILSANVERFTAIVRQTDITTMSMCIGVQSSGTVADETAQGYYFSFNPATDSHWRTITRDATDIESQNTTVTVTSTNWYLLDIVHDFTTPSIKFYVNNTLVTTHTTRIPTTQALLYSFALDSNEAVAKVMDVDYIRVETRNGQRWT